MREVVICEPARTAVGRFGGIFKSLSAADLAASVITSLLKRTGVGAEEIDDVILGQCYPNGEAPGIGRVAALNAGLPVTVTGLQIDRRCGSGLQAVLFAAMQVESGISDVILAGGTESMSQAEFYSTEIRWGVRSGELILRDRLTQGRVTAGGRNHVLPGGMLETAENLRREYRISRLEQDELAFSSHHRAVQAQIDGRFKDEIVPTVVRQQADEVVIDMDEHPRADTTLESLSHLRPIMVNVDSEATVTAGNASGQNDAAALCIVTHIEKAFELGLQPIVKLVSWAVAGVPPRTMGIGPVPATNSALDRAGLTLSDMDLIELNEAFAAQVLACTREWQFAASDFERLNVNGSGISIGHPVGATGGRILATLCWEMRRRQARYGLETMCIGGGQGIAAIFESVA